MIFFVSVFDFYHLVLSIRIHTVLYSFIHLIFPSLSLLSLHCFSPFGAFAMQNAPITFIMFVYSSVRMK
jgi:hypothetical protein